MSPADITAIAREGLTDGGLYTYEQLNPVPMDRLSSGHRFAGCDLTSDPDCKDATMWIDGDLVTLFDG